MATGSKRPTKRPDSVHTTFLRFWQAVAHAEALVLRVKTPGDVPADGYQPICDAFLGIHEHLPPRDPFVFRAFPAGISPVTVSSFHEALEWMLSDPDILIGRADVFRDPAYKLLKKAARKEWTAALAVNHGAHAQQSSVENQPQRQIPPCPKGTPLNRHEKIWDCAVSLSQKGWFQRRDLLNACVEAKVELRSDRSETVKRWLQGMMRAEKPPLLCRSPRGPRSTEYRVPDNQIFPKHSKRPQ